MVTEGAQKELLERSEAIEDLTQSLQDTAQELEQM